jgi:apolipoprotein N-acyltransferase
MMEYLRRWHESPFGCALTGAALLWLALPPCDFWPLAWLAPVWWVLLIRRPKLADRRAKLSAQRPYLQLWMAGFVFWLAAYWWLVLPHWATSFGWLGVAIYSAFYLPVFVGLSRTAVHRLRLPIVLVAPVIWTGLELVRAYLITGTTLANIGHTQYRWLDLIQISDLVGAYGVSFVVMFVAACLGRMVACGPARWTLWPLLPAVALLGAVLVYGHLRRLAAPDPRQPPAARLALIQGSIDSVLKADPEMRNVIYQEYFGLSQQAARQFGRLDALVWPETMFPVPLILYDADAARPPDYQGSESQFRLDVAAAAEHSRQWIATTAQRLGAPLIIGIDTCWYLATGPVFFNSALHVSTKGEILERYDKMHRVLFGEYVPLADYLPWLRRLTPLHVLVTAGEKPTTFAVGRLRLAPSICYENVLPQVIRHQVQSLAAAGQEPDALVNLTNDGWFWGSSELDMHLVCAVFRAVECRKPFLIAANTGFSAHIDGDGRILARGPRRATAVLLAEVLPDNRQSWYLRYGDWGAGLCLLVVLGVAAAGCWPPRHGAKIVDSAS